MKKCFNLWLLKCRKKDIFKFNIFLSKNLYVFMFDEKIFLFGNFLVVQENLFLFKTKFISIQDFLYKKHPYSIKNDLMIIEICETFSCEIKFSIFIPLIIYIYTYR